MRVIRKDLKRNRIAELAGFVAVHVEFEELIVYQLLAGDRVRAVFFKPGNDVRELEDESCVGAYRVLVGLERQRAKVEGEPFEREVRLGLEAAVRAEAVGRRPLAMGDVEFVGSYLAIRQLSRSFSSGFTTAPLPIVAVGGRMKRDRTHNAR